MDTAASSEVTVEWNLVQRRLIKFGIEQTAIFQVQPGANIHLPMQQELKKQAEIINRSNIDDGWRTLDPWASSNFRELNSQMPFRQNLVIKEGEKVLLHRMGIYNLGNYTAQKKAEERGRELLAACQDQALCHQDSTARTGHKIFHFGIWTDRVNKLYITKDTRQDKTVGRGKNAKVVIDEEAANATMEFCLWYKNYVDKYVYPLVKSNKYGISPSIKEVYNQHKEVYNWLLDQEVAPAARHICHEMYSTFSPFPGYSPNMHPDGQDSDYSFLINFGAKCLLSLGPYKLKVDLQPFDVVFFDTKIDHMTEPKEGDTDKNKRWSISGYVRNHFVNEIEADDNSVAAEFGATNYLAAEVIAARAVALQRNQN